MIDFDQIEREEGPQAKSIATFVQAHMPVRTVVDIGCGPGTYVRAMREVGLDAIGVDNDPRMPDTEYLISADILKYYFSKKDLALCLEVGEHLPEDKADAFVDKVVSASDLVIFSAAFPGQGGDGHINCQPKQYWIDKFAQRGYTVDASMTDALIIHVKKNMHLGWFVINSMVFKKL